MTIGIPGGHFFFHLSIPSPSFPASLRHSRLLSVIPGLTGNLFQKSSKPFRKRKISDWVLLKAHIILKFVA